ncbi:MAG: hypothetical protein ACE5HB_11335 [Terriglobia bacterium]
MGLRQCPFCGKATSDRLRDCTHCHETLPELRKRAAAPSVSTGEGGPLIRRGLTYIVLGIAARYFLADDRFIALPAEFSSLVTTWGVPLLIFGGLGLLLYGIGRQFSV